MILALLIIVYVLWAAFVIFLAKVDAPRTIFRPRVMNGFYTKQNNDNN